MPRWLRPPNGGAVQGWKCEIPGIRNYLGRAGNWRELSSDETIIDTARGVSNALERWMNGTGGLLWLTDGEREELVEIIDDIRYNIETPDYDELEYQLNQMYDWADAYRFIIGGERKERV